MSQKKNTPASCGSSGRCPGRSGDWVPCPGALQPLTRPGIWQPCGHEPADVWSDSFQKELEGPAAAGRPAAPDAAARRRCRRAAAESTNTRRQSAWQSEHKRVSCQCVSVVSSGVIVRVSVRAAESRSPHLSPRAAIHMAPPLLLCCLLTVAAAAMEAALQPDVSPHITGCVSANMETFRCRWDVGPFQSDQLRLFYINKKHPHSPAKDWTECPHYSSQRPNECFFNENHTSIWTLYTIQLRSTDESIIYDQKVLDVADSVQPDPPLQLSWTLLNQSVTSSYSDIMLSWKPPESADVETGWLRLQYEVQYRKVEVEQWQAAELVTSTDRTLYGLQTDVDYEVRVRCRMLAGKAFGDFSDSVFVHIPSKVSHLPAVALLVFAALCVVAVLMLVAASQQEKLMVLLLPPVPGPKIRGIDSELLKKGELTSILGSPLDLRPEPSDSEPWVELIHLDVEEPTRLTDLRPDWLVKASPSSSCSPASASFGDPPSGGADCREPDPASEAEASTVHPPTPSQASDQPTACLLRGTAAREASYTQVREVSSNGKLLLSPELEQGSSKELRSDTEGGDPHAFAVNRPGSQGAPEGHAGDASEPGDAAHPSSSHDRESSTTAAPAPVYTLVDGVSGRNSLVLTPNATPGLQLMIPKNLPTPTAYLTPDLLGSITP